MATPIELDRTGALFKLDVLEPAVQEFRQFYASPDLHRWIVGALRTLASALNLETSPLEQFDDLAGLFCAGERLTYGIQFKPLTHITDGVWELKTQDIRIFGLVPQKGLLHRRSS
jgi:hypothetical protein